MSGEARRLAAKSPLLLALKSRLSLEQSMLLRIEPAVKSQEVWEE